MRINSLNAYKHNKTNQPTQRARVFATIKRRPQLGFTRKELAEEMNIPINSITGRVRELLDAGALVEDGQRKQPGDRTASAVLKVKG